MYKAIGHCRVSKGDKDEIQNSLKSQQSEIIKLALRLNIKESEIKWYIESEARSAFKENANWSKFEEAIEEACTNPTINFFLEYNQDRFARNIKLSQLYKDKLKNANVQLRFSSGDIENPDSVEGLVLGNTFEMLAQLYSTKVGLDTLRGCKENARTRDKETGFAFKNGGSAPFWLKSKKVVIGLDKNGEDIKKTIWVENDTIHTAIIDGKPVTKTLWEWSRFYFIELRLNRKLGIEKARDILNEYEVPAPRGKYWATTCLHSAEEKESLMGIGIYNKRWFGKSGRGQIKDKAEWIIVENANPALLTQSEFMALQTLKQSKLKRIGTTSTCQSNNEHILTGEPEKFVCKSCGSKIISSGGVYTCGRYNTNGKKGCGAPYFSVKSEELEDYVFEVIEKSLSDREIKILYAEMIKNYKDGNSNASDELRTLNLEHSKQEKAKINLVKSLSFIGDDDDTTREALIDELTSITNKIKAFKKRAEELSKPKSVKIPTYDQFKTQVYKAKSLLTHSSFYQKRKYIWIFIKSITLDPIERQVVLDVNKNPLCMFMEDLEKGKNIVEGAFAPSTEMVAGAGFEPTTFGL